jgi:hypothetical protein
MTDRAARFTAAYTLPRLLVAITAAASLLTIALDVLDRSAQTLWPNALVVVIPLGYTLVGALIWVRQPQNAIGWLFAVTGTGLSLLGGAAQSYAVWALLVHPGAPAGMLALWLGSPAFDSLFFLLVFLLLQLFPNGRPLAPRWRFAVWATVIGSLLGLGQALQHYNLDPPLQAYDNPYIVHGRAADLLDVAGALSSLLLLVGALASVASVALRYRRSRGIERLQLRWFVAAVLAVLALAIAALAVYVATGADLSNGIFPIAVLLLPAATGIAILRYRLYEIDVLIRRTLVYGCLVAGLAALYLAGIVLLDGVLRVATGQTSTLAVTGSTLLVAFAFQPLRNRVQALVDHRFYRSRYDADRTLAAFSGRLRDQLDLEALEREMLEVVGATVHPGHAELWLRDRELRP